MAALTATECRACMQASCDTGVVEACDAAPGCLERLAWSGDPNVIHARDRTFSDGRWQALQGGTDTTKISYDYLRCAQHACPVECNTGTDFSCAGAFEWNAPFPETVRIQVIDGILGKAPAPGLDVSLCLDSDVPCAEPIATGHTDERGIETLSLDKPPNVKAFDGHLLARDGAGVYTDYVAVSSRPPDNSEFTNYYPFTDAATNGWLTQLDVQLAPNQTLVQVLPFDCQGVWAKGVKIELWTLDGEGPSRCETCKIAYEGEDGFSPSLELEALTGRGAQAYIARAPAARRVAVVLRHVSELGGDIVAVHPLSLLPNTRHYLRLYPYPRSRRYLVGAIDPPGGGER